jgi:hypothetical protein
VLPEILPSANGKATICSVQDDNLIPSSSVMRVILRGFELIGIKNA